MAESIKVGTYTPESKPGKYEAHVQALIDADEQRTPEQVEAGTHASIAVTFPKTYTTGKGEERDALPRNKRWFQESAKALGVTARQVDEQDQADGISVVVTFIVVPQVIRTRKPKPKPKPVTDIEPDKDAPETVAA